MKSWIRSAQGTDLAILVEFNRALALETENLALDRQRLTHGVQAVLDDPVHGFYTVVQLEEAVVACAQITFEWSDWRNAQFWWLQSVYVHPNYRRQGLFRALYHHLRDEAHRAGACGLRLYVEHNNHLAQNTYRSLGMSPSHYALFEEGFSSTAPDTIF
ncbi:GNAT family N-acetyltransferase [Anthocerotibacter panamensis]|uniref:GNAT family N-acetyltransferase n=1 Tax=Anthocerotibacter panamensis TaxID=2857077 RepID=UPI001C408A58|nr:GNAT family N-acetyltransferase [Anthocerotibacter panamensis]